MELVIALVVAVAVSFAFRNAIKAHAWVFYLIATAMVAAFAALSISGEYPTALRPAYPYFQRCLLGFGFFAVVMYIGVLPEGSKARRWLNPIRGELSIIASLLTAGHVLNYLSSYIERFLAGYFGSSAAMATSFAVALLLVILLIPLAITSVNAIRRRMHAASWKRLQLLAYPFFILIFVHLVFLLGPSASAPGQKAFTSVAIYTAVFGLYVVLRVARAVLDRRAAVRKANARA